jgi:hypothetical protein
MSCGSNAASAEGSTSVAACTCNPGYYGTVTFSAPSTVTNNCQTCGGGKYLSSSGATAEGACQVCVAGKFSPAAGGASVCNDCGTGKYVAASAGGAQTCTDCATTADTSTSTTPFDVVAKCACKAGYLSTGAAGDSQLTCTVISRAPGLLLHAC